MRQEIHNFAPRQCKSRFTAMKLLISIEIRHSLEIGHGLSIDIWATVEFNIMNPTYFIAMKKPTVMFKRNIFFQTLYSVNIL